jgi:hypothetical protein
MNGRVAWLIRRGFELEPGLIRFDYNYDRLQWLWTVSLTACNEHCSSPSSSGVNLDGRPTLLPGPTRTGFYWAGTRLAFELPLSSWTASHCSLELLCSAIVLLCPVQTFVLAYGVLAWTVPAEKWLLIHYCGNANPRPVSYPRIRELPWIHVYVWLLQNTSQYEYGPRTDRTWVGPAASFSTYAFHKRHRTPPSTELLSATEQHIRSVGAVLVTKNEMIIPQYSVSHRYGDAARSLT